MPDIANTHITKITHAPARRLVGAAATVTTTWQGLRGQARRLVTTSLAVLLGVAFTTGILVLTDTMRESFDRMHVATHAEVDLVVRKPASFGSGPEVARETVEVALVTAVAETGGVVAAAGHTSGWAQLSSGDGTLLGDVAAGIDPVGENWIPDPRLNPWTIVEGAPPSGPHDVVIDHAAAETLGLSVGDRVDVLALGGTSSMTVAGVVSFGDDDRRFGTVTALFDDATAQRLLGVAGRHDSLLVALADDADLDGATAKLRDVAGSDHEVVTGDQLVEETRAVHLEDWGFFDSFMKMFAVIALVVGGFIIFNTFSMTVAQRTREFAMLRAIGAGRGQVLGSVLVESLTVGVVASAAGVASGVWSASGLRSVFEAVGLELPDGGVVVQTGSLVTAFTIGVAVTLFSALLPAHRAARTAPVAAIRTSALETRGGSRLRLLIGTAVVVTGGIAMGAGLGGVVDEPIALVGLGGLAVFAGVAALGPALAGPFGRLAGRPIAAARGVPDKLAGDNVTRNPKRTAATAAALMIGVGLVGFITILAASIKVSINEMVAAGVRSDIVIESGSFGYGGLDRSLVDELRALPEVDAVSGSTLETAAIDGEVVEIVGVDSVDYAAVIDLGHIEGSLAGDAGTGLGLDGVVATTQVATERGWSVGTPVAVTLADGIDRVLTVEAVVEDPYIGLPVLVDRALLEEAGQAPFDEQVFVGVADDVDPAAALAAVAAVAERLPNADVLDRDGFAGFRAGLVDPLLGIIYALLGFAVLIAALGITNTLALSITERTRELGVLRAVGASRAQIRTSIRWESVMIAGFGTTLGLAIGTGFGWAVVRALGSEGIGQLAMPVGALLTIVALAVATGVVAAAPPARRAARLDVLDALRS